ncbi:MAG: hypothetical protein DI598_07505 [Pseudopedobacter saltans]|uniref:Uncharacterized protein n=1 Tax=Pseudopedobacter saltans TaxID=151895 RepID=A0A2W5F7F8_9SPHI|nr:MAG: hypothetical protein DI598_07505 [Pseudopedobacter saltans]
MAIQLMAFAGTPAGKAAISAVTGSLGKLVGGLFKGHSDWYYLRQHFYGFSINVNGDKSKEFGADVWDMVRSDLKNGIAQALQGDAGAMDNFGDGGNWYLVARAALPYQSQYFNIPADNQLIEIACQLLAGGILPTDNKVFTAPTLGSKYNESWVKYQIDNVAAVAELKKTDYWLKNYGSQSSVASGASAVSNTVSNALNSVSTALVQPKTDQAGNVVTDANGVVQYETKTSVWVIVVVVAACIVCLGFVGRLFGKKKRK